MLILRMRIAASRIGLPYLDEGVGNRTAIFIEDASADDDPLADSLAAIEMREVDIAGADELAFEARSGDFGQRMLDPNERLLAARA